MLFLANEGHVGRFIACVYYIIHGCTLTYFACFMVRKKAQLQDMLHYVSNNETNLTLLKPGNMVSIHFSS